MNPVRTAALALPLLQPVPAEVLPPELLFATPLAWGDIDGDGRLDLYLADPAGGDRLLAARADGTFEDRSEALGPTRHSVAALVLDVDHDRRADFALLGRDGRPTLLVGVEGGGWIDASERLGRGELAGVRALRALDYDGDGWLDLALRTSSSEVLLHSSRGALFTETLTVPAPLDGAPWILSGSTRERPSEEPSSASLGATPRTTHGPKVNVTPGGGAASTGGGHICAGTIEDFASPATCLSASSVPMLGMLFPLGIELFVDAASGNVGVGTTSPSATLDVAGTARMDGFALPTGASDGKVLVSDASGNGSWQSMASSANTLDQAYDQGGSGAGRAIAADAGAVLVAASGNDALQLSTDGSSDALRVAVSSDPGGSGVRVLQGGAGSGVRIEHSGPATGLVVLAGGNGSAATFAVTDATNALAAVAVEHDGKGDGVSVELENAASAASAVRGVTSGTGRGVLGRQGPDPDKGNAAAKAGVAGESRDEIGVSGWSDESVGVQGRSPADDGVQGHSKDANGVAGSTERTGTWAAGGGSGEALRAGVKGSSPDVATVDSFAVVGNASGYGIGVLGLGGADAGHGVFGIGHSAADGDKTVCGVRGVTKEGTNAHGSLQDGTGKVKVGVLGQAQDFAGVWGESTERVGVAGTGGAMVPSTHLPAGKVGVYGQAEAKVLDPSQPSEGGVIGLAESLPGVQGWSRASDAVIGLSLEKHGVLGESRSADPAMAGVSARGEGPAGAAALNVHDGAITVSGPSRPAGTFPLTGGWMPYSTCEGGCADCPHAHVMGWRTFETVSNPLLRPDSIVLLTVAAPSAGEGYAAHLGGTGDGVMDVVVTTVGKAAICQQPTVAVTVHYLIVNPLP